MNMRTTSSVQVLAKNGKSFYFAGLFLPQKQLHTIAELYSFCRYVDDSADELHPEQARKEIERIKRALHLEGEDKELNHILESLQRNGVLRQHLEDLVTGADWDINKVLIQNEKQLDLYCYYVAGVVGLMMNPLMQVSSPVAGEFAKKLGHAMQLTNICRDVLEDALNQRTYLPLEELRQAGLDLKSLQKKGGSPGALKEIVSRYLKKAENLYQEGYKGLPYIPLRCRFVILLAGELYRHIGVKIIHQDYEVLNGRVYLSLSEKFWVLFKSTFKALAPGFWIKPRNEYT